MQGAISVGENLAKREIQSNISCIHCVRVESTTHLLFQCEFPKKVWSISPLRETFDPSEVDNFQVGIKAARSMICLPPSRLSRGRLFPWICWVIWFSRNYLLFENRVFSLEETLHKSLIDAKEWQVAQEFLDTKLTTNDPTPPIPSALTSIVCHTDAAWRENDKTAGLGWIFKDQTGRTIHKGYKAETSIMSPLQAEALAVRQVLLHAIDSGWTFLTIKI